MSSLRISTPCTRQPASIGLHDMVRYVTFGVSPRASINMVIAAQALALVRGRQYVLPEDLLTMAPDVLRHRLVLSYEALADDVTAQPIRIVRGHVEVSDAPGLGVDVDEDRVRRYRRDVPLRYVA